MFGFSYNYSVFDNNNQVEAWYGVKTDIYSGPLDLLLDLIQKAELDITKLALASVTDQYLAYIEQLQQKNASDISEFLIIAARLIQIKSEALLPRPMIREEGEEDLGESLARQLIIYREIKMASKWLREQDDNHKHSFLHVAKSYNANVTVDFNGISLTNLVDAISSIYNSDAELKSLGTVISIPKLTLKRKIQSIIINLAESKTSTFYTLVGSNRTRVNLLVVFLALLELIKQDYVTTEQGEIFGDFNVFATDKIRYSNEIELSLDD